MPFYRVNGTLVHVRMTNTKKRPAPPQCRETIAVGGHNEACLGMATLLCDFELPGGGTCDRSICACCAVQVGPNRHLCPFHSMQAPRPTRPQLTPERMQEPKAPGCISWAAWEALPPEVQWLRAKLDANEAAAMGKPSPLVDGQ